MFKSIKNTSKQLAVKVCSIILLKPLSSTVLFGLKTTKYLNGSSPFIKRDRTQHFQTYQVTKVYLTASHKNKTVIFGFNGICKKKLKKSNLHLNPELS